MPAADDDQGFSALDVMVSCNYYKKQNCMNLSDIHHVSVVILEQMSNQFSGESSLFEQLVQTAVDESNLLCVNVTNYGLCAEI